MFEAEGRVFGVTRGEPLIYQKNFGVSEKGWLLP